MTHDDRMLDLAERVADGYSNATDDRIRELATWALLQRAEYERERALRLAAESLLNELVLRTSPVQPSTTETPLWLTTLRSEGLL